VVEGSLLFPACDLPDDLEVCAEGDVTVCTRELVSAGPNVGYRLALPPGQYKIYSHTESMLPGIRAYFTDAVKCGMSTECRDHEPITIGVRAGARIRDVHPADWNE
jgi:hypothetical protein